MLGIHIHIYPEGKVFMNVFSLIDNMSAHENKHLLTNIYV